MRGVLVVLVAVAGCNPYDHDLGSAPFLCGPTEPRCPKDYVCVEGTGTNPAVCVSSPPDGGVGCGDESLEPNNTIATATPTPVDTMRTYVVDGVAICPSSDNDTYAITIGAANENIEALVAFDAAGGTLHAAILNTGGVPIASATSVGMPMIIRAYAQNLPAANYYAQVSGPTTGSYKLTINVTGP